MRLSDHLAQVFGEGDRPAWPTSQLPRPPAVEFMRAVDGQESPPPVWWSQNKPQIDGSGAWGCLHSHTRAAQDAAADHLESVLVLEDDVVFQPDAAERLAVLMADVPEDWHMIFLGGQHQTHPRILPDSPGVMRCANTHRTHAFALKLNFFHDYLRHIWEAPDYQKRPESHIDQQLGVMHARGERNFYVPEWHIAGQAAGPSNISGKLDPERWWHPEMHKRSLPLVVVDPVEGVSSLAPELLPRLHFGNNLLPDTLQDEGLDEYIQKGQLKSWLSMISREAIDLGRCPGISHPGLDKNGLEDLWPVIVGADVQLDQLRCPRA